MHTHTHTHTQLAANPPPQVCGPNVASCTRESCASFFPLLCSPVGLPESTRYGINNVLCQSFSSSSCFHQDTRVVSRDRSGQRTSFTMEDLMSTGTGTGKGSTYTYRTSWAQAQARVPSSPPKPTQLGAQTRGKYI